MSEPKRRERRNPHLDASIMPVERALLARAAHLETAIDDGEPLLPPDIRRGIAVEFRDLAEELHFW